MRDHFTSIVVLGNVVIAVLVIAAARLLRQAVRDSDACSVFVAPAEDTFFFLAYAGIASWLVLIVAIICGCLIYRLSWRQRASYVTATLLVGPALALLVDPGNPSCGC